MENSKEKKQVLLKDGREEQRTIVLKKKPLEVSDLLKKAALYIIIGTAFLGCMFLIFGGESENDKGTTIFNDVIPQASGGELQSDKQKAYEKELLQKNAEEKRQALITLSDYWQNDTANNENEAGFSNLDNTDINDNQDKIPSSAKGYQSIRNTLDNFYTPDDENQKLREELKAFKEKEKANEAQISNNPMQNQLELMEKSFQMAAKYLPQTVNENNQSDSIPIQMDDRLVQPVYSENRSVVSSLYRNPEDSNYNSYNEGNSFHSVRESGEVNNLKNSIRAVVHQRQIVRIGGSLKIRLTEPMRVESITIPKGEILSGTVKFESGRVGLHIYSLEFGQRIFQVELSAYDTDGQKGLYMPHSPEMNAVREIFSGMGNSAATSITMNNSATDQITADLTKGVIKGISGYLGGKNQMPKLTFKAGHELLLVSKK